MIDKLKKHYQDSLIIGEAESDKTGYIWYVTDEGTTFGIEKNSISKEEEILLSSLFHQLEERNSQLSDEQSAWYQFLYLNKDSMKDSMNGLKSSYQFCRFIQFQLDKSIADLNDFQEALQALFPYPIIVLWEDDYHGILIDTNVEEKESFTISFEEIADTITSDFYVTTRFFIGQTYPFGKNLQENFNWERLCFKKSLVFLHKQSVYRLSDIIPYVILEKLEPSLKSKLTESVLQELKNDKELLETIKVFLQSNLNVSHAAKTLYMHRNSLQYRIDKFIEKTGIDIKHFQGAITTYLAIINHEHFSDS